LTRNRLFLRKYGKYANTPPLEKYFFPVGEKKSVFCKLAGDSHTHSIYK
jgi:hypothetical protein